jgi:nucleoside-diphosphate-sugar epimerase
MRILLTGHTGYIGTVMAPMLAQAGHEVVGLDTGLFEECVLGSPPAPIPELRADIRDVGREDLAGFDALVHLAALSNDPLGELDPQCTYDINLHATVRLAELARAAGIERFVYSSSCSVYGASGGDELVDERAPMAPVTAYAISKVKVEDELRQLADDDFSPIYMRNATVYGFSPRLRTDLVLNDLVARAHLGGEVTVLSDGTPWRPIIHVSDVARAFLAALEAPRERVHNEAFNIGDEQENYRVRTIAEIVERTVPGAELVITGETGPDPRSYRVSFAKVREHLPAFRPAWNAERGAAELYEQYRRHGLTAQAFARRYRRLPWLQQLLDAGAVTTDLRWTASDADARQAG